MTNNEYYVYLIECGFSESEAKIKMEEREIMIKLYFSDEKREPREITSSTYKRAQKKLNKKVNDFLGINK